MEGVNESPATNAQNGSSFPFFDLPPELRENIIRRFVVFPFESQSGPPYIPVRRSERGSRFDNTVWQPYEYYPLNLLLVSKRMYHETMRSWWIYNTFIWHITHLRPSQSYLAPPDPGDIKVMMEVRHLIVKVMHIENSAQWHQVIMPTLQDLVTKGELVNVEFEMHINSHSLFAFDLFFPDYELQRPRSQPGTWDIATCSPPPALRSLLDFLAHPKLNQASLHIDRLTPGDFASTWCPFYDYVTDDEPSSWGVAVRWKDFRARLPSVSSPTPTSSVASSNTMAD